MSLPIFDLEITHPLPNLQLTEHQPGFAAILRYRDRPIGFILQPVVSEKRIAAADLDRLIGEEIGPKILQETLREELHWTTSITDYPTLSIAICTKDRPALIERCLRSLQSVVANHSSAIEILIIDNAPSDDSTKTLVETFTNVRYVCEPLAGLDVARNCALREATGDYIAYLDDDVVVDRGWLMGFYEAWAEHPQAAAFTGLILPYELATEAQVLFEQAGGFRRGFDKIYYGQTLPGNSLYPCGAGIFGAGCNMAYRREILIALGGFDVALDTGKPLPGGGDLDMFYHIIRSGNALIYEPRYLVFHQHRQTLEQLQRQYWSWGLGLMAFISKSLHSDRPLRKLHLRLIAWWVKYQLGRLKRSIRGRYPLSAPMILAELWGGIQGLCGEYGRSQTRMKHLQQRFIDMPCAQVKQPLLSSATVEIPPSPPFSERGSILKSPFGKGGFRGI
jgi:glycosyltransferase involved in cell wall biosynthesis